MATVRPFTAIRPEKKYADKVISLPYDVMNRQEASDMAEGNPYSFLHICRSEIDLPEQENPYDRSVYEKARDNIEKYLREGVFREEEKPALYVYRQIMDGRVQTGIVGCVSVDEYQNNIIKKHEFTRVEKEQDRINHFDVCDADTEPVFLTYRDDKRIRTIVEGFAAGNEPEYDITAEDGIRHILWVIDDDKIVNSITELFSEIPALYIADGHHRSASACKVGMKRREENPGYTGNEEFNFFMAAIFPDNDLKIFDYNRVVKDLNGNSAEEFIKKIEAAGFEVGEVTTDESDEDEGTVIRQSPGGGEQAEKGTTVDIVVSDGSQAQAVVPYLIGRTIGEAQTALSNAGLSMGSISYEYSSTYAEGEVMWQQYDANARLDRGSTVRVRVSRGPQPQQTTAPSGDSGDEDNE